ncbi:FAD-dependent oxidoreductase [Planctomycetales bacterium ZRK34]|nr:FAD-dependent oxidoreductase [Planctomycetales bacterium ZRK34]
MLRFRIAFLSVLFVLPTGLFAAESSPRQTKAASEAPVEKTDAPKPDDKDIVWHDVVIYGGTSAAITAAIQAKKMGKSVIVISPDKHLGGLTSGGLGWTDSGKKEVVGGLSLMFYERVFEHYQKPEAWKQQKREEYGNRAQGTPAADGRAMWVFEPHVAETIYDQLVKEYEIEVLRDTWLDRGPGGVRNSCCRILWIKTLDGRKFAGQMFIDATYEGDLMAAAGVTFTTGREPNSKYDETINGVQAPAHKHQFTHDISPYVVPGDPSSGVLPRVQAPSPDVPGENGSGDKRIQAYNFRMCLTNVPENRVPFPKPEGYDAKQYELLLRSLQAGSRHVFGKFDPLPNHKTDTNNHGPFSTDNIGYNYDYPTGSYERRREIIAEHELYQKGYFWFLCNDPRVPEDVRKRMNEWGLAKDEFLDNGHWPHQIYVREARRLVGQFVVTENHLRYLQPTPRPVGMGSYNMDSHNVQRYVDKDGFVRNEGDIQKNPGGPYPIDYGAIVPAEGECDNLFVTCAVSASHIAYGSIRMEPVFMILGQSAATAACMAIDDHVSVQQVSYDKLRKRLLADGQVLEWDGPRKKTAEGISPKSLKGIVVDDNDARFTGEWGSSRAVGPYIGFGYRHDYNAEHGSKSVTFTAKLPEPGTYEVRLYYPPSDNRASNAIVIVDNGSKKQPVPTTLRQTDPGKPYRTLGRYEFKDTAAVSISNKGTDGYIVVDAVQLLPVK